MEDQFKELRDYIDERTGEMETHLLTEFCKRAIRIESSTKPLSAADPLIERLQDQPVAESKPWSRDDLYDDVDAARLKEEMARMKVQIPESSDAILEQIAREKSISKVEVLRRLLAVLDVVQEHQQKGSQLALVDSDGKLVSRLIGI